LNFSNISTNGMLFISPAGTVGINTTTPNAAYKLDVNGAENAISYAVGGVAGVTKTCTTPITGLTIIAGIITTITCP